VTRTERDRLQELRAAVINLYRVNRQQGYAAWRGIDYDFTCPALGLYQHQWFWDSCFHAVVLSRFDVPRAEAELETLLASQQSDGFIPHVTYWAGREPPTGTDSYRVASRSPWSSDSMGPPILAEAVAAVAARGRGVSYLREVLPRVRRYYDWCERVRDPDRNGLIAVLEPHETGTDQSPQFDAHLGVSGDDPMLFEAAWRGLMEAQAEVRWDARAIFGADQFVVEDVLVNALYAENQRVLGELLAQVGDVAGAAELRGRATRTETGLVERCWSASEGDFRSLAGQAEERLPGATVSGLMPLLLPRLPAAIAGRLAKRIADPREFATRFPVPSVSRLNPAYRPAPGGGSLLWRGPTWINANWYLARGLRRHGHDEPARAIEDASLELVERSGFREHYNPETGEGYGAKGFAWSGLVLDMLAARTDDSGAVTSP
jgi:glycogen debranching enzyme